MIHRTIRGAVHWKSSARKVIHLNNVIVLGDLILEFPSDLGQGFEFKPPFNGMQIRN